MKPIKFNEKQIKELIEFCLLFVSKKKRDKARYHIEKKINGIVANKSRV